MTNIVSAATLALAALLVSLSVCGAVLLRRRGLRRWVGVALLFEAVLALAVLVALCIVPFGISEPLIRVALWQTLLQVGGLIVVLGGVCGMTFWVGRRLMQVRQPRITVAGLLVVVPLIAGSGMVGLTRWSLPERERQRDPNQRKLTLSPGFKWSVYAQGTMDNPTAITFGPDGKLYIADIGGTLWVASDRDGNYQIDSITRWAGDFSLLVGLV